ncbi:hypothetical protein D3C81_1555650 [compost metagenome]
MLLHQCRNIAVEGAAILTAGERVHSRLTHIIPLALFVRQNGFTEHRFQSRRLIHLASFNGINDVHQYRTRCVAQIQAKQDNHDGGQRKSPTDNVRLVTCDIGERGIRNAVNDEPVRVCKGIVVVPEAGFTIVGVPLAAGHLVHQLFTDIGFK